MKNKNKLSIISIIALAVIVIFAIIVIILDAFTSMNNFMWYDLNVLRKLYGIVYLRFTCCTMFVIFVFDVIWLITSTIKNRKH